MRALLFLLLSLSLFSCENEFMTVDVEDLDEAQLLGTWNIAALETIAYGIDTIALDTFTRTTKMTDGTLEITLNEDGSFISSGNFTGTTTFSQTEEVIMENYSDLGEGAFFFVDNQLFLDVLVVDEDDLVIDPNFHDPELPASPFTVDEFDPDVLIKLSGFFAPEDTGGTVNGQSIVLEYSIKLTLVR